MADRGNKARRLKDVKKYFDRYLCINIQGDLLTAPSQGTAKYICAIFMAVHEEEEEGGSSFKGSPYTIFAFVKSYFSLLKSIRMTLNLKR